MISIKYALFLVAAFAAGSFLTPPVQQAIAAVIATDVQCTGCVGANDIATSAVTTTKLASNSVNGGKITDGTLSAADLGPDSVGASEIKGVTKMIFNECIPSDTVKNQNIGPGGTAVIYCNISGVDSNDFVSATLMGAPYCIVQSTVTAETGRVRVVAFSDCDANTTLMSTARIAIVVYDD